MLHFVQRGRGPALVLLHAFPLDHTLWNGQVAEFSATHRVITPDIRGFGGSMPPAPWTMADMGEELLLLLDSLGVDRCTLGGLSMGGYIALPFTAKYPQRVERLILAHTRARADTEVERRARSMTIASLERDGISAILDSMPARLLRPNPPAELFQQVRKAVATTLPLAAIHAVTAMRDRPDSTSLLPGIQCPALVITGAHDVILSPADSRSMADALPKSTFVEIPDAGHLGNIENPAAFNAALRTFLV